MFDATRYRCQELRDAGYVVPDELFDRLNVEISHGKSIWEIGHAAD